MLSFRAVTLQYPGAGEPVFRDVNLDVAAGEFVFLTGPSGSGKTSLLRLVYGAARPTRGEVLVGGVAVGRTPAHLLRRRIGVVFQDNRLLPHKTLMENVAFAGEVLGRPRREVRRRALELLEQVGLSEQAGRRPDKLSAGERQRAAIARALMNEPRLLLADEPTGNLDPENARRIFDLFLEINRATGTTCLVATHAVHLVDAYPARHVALSGGRLHERPHLEAAP